MKSSHLKSTHTHLHPAQHVHVRMLYDEYHQYFQAERLCEGLLQGCALRHLQEIIHFECAAGLEPDRLCG